MAGLAGNIPVDAYGHGLLYFEMAVLARRFTLNMAHTAGPGLMTVDALDLFGNMHVLRQARGFREVFPKIAVPSSPLHGPCMADERAPPSAGTIR